MKYALSVHNVSKAYKRYSSKWSKLQSWLRPKKQNTFSLTWVVKGVSFTLSPGESVGLIGLNGAGKSTLLKLIARTVTPTEGHVETHGRIAALLELGIGFHPEFTGRQNVYLAGQLLGLTVPEIQKAMPEIVAFAEIGEYIDQPVRVYSSGMQVRLAFSVATAIRPEILIIDEALSVGDAYFQHKSFERIKQFKQKGTTLLLVSHDRQAIQSICDRVIVMAEGKSVMDATPAGALDFYNALLAGKSQQITVNQERKDAELQTVSGNGKTRFCNICLKDENDAVIEMLTVGQKVRLEVILEAKALLSELVIGYMIKNKFGQIIFGTNTHNLNSVVKDVSVGSTITQSFFFEARLGQGNYSISVAAHKGSNHVIESYEWRDLALVFNVVNTTGEEFIGTAWLPTSVECVRT